MKASTNRCMMRGIVESLHVYIYRAGLIACEVGIGRAKLRTFCIKEFMHIFTTVSKSHFRL